MHRWETPRNEQNYCAVFITYLLRCTASIVNNFFDVAFTGLLELFTFFVLRIMI